MMMVMPKIKDVVKKGSISAFVPYQRLLYDKSVHDCVALRLMVRVNCPFKAKSDQNWSEMS